MTYSSYISMAKMRLIKPQVDEISERYPKPEDAQKKQKATMELYGKVGINPLGGVFADVDSDAYLDSDVPFLSPLRLSLEGVVPLG